MKNFFKWLDNAPTWVQILTIAYVVIFVVVFGTLMFAIYPKLSFILFFIIPPILVGIAYYRHKTKK